MAINGDLTIKLDRARRHLKDLDTAIGNWARGGHHNVINEPDPDRGSDWWRIRVEADPIPVEPFATLIGDILHNFRGTLDHLAYALLTKYTAPPIPDNIAEESEFPIFGDKSRKGVIGKGPHMFASSGRSKIIGIHPGAQAIIESLQPYHRGNDYVSHPLWMLHELSNIDKHRFHIVSNVRSVAAGFRPNQTKNWDPTEVEVYNPVVGHSDTIAARYRRTPRDPKHEVHVEFDPFMQIVFGDGTAVYGKGLLRVLPNIEEYITKSVLPPLSKFL